jgi:hypothetical protein
MIAPERHDSGAPPQDVSELRATPRFSLLIRSAKLVYENAEYLCIVRDVSASGVRLRLFHPLPPDERVTLELATGETFAIERVWEREDHGGFRFADPIDVERFIAEAGPYPKRPLRLRMALDATLSAEDSTLGARICDLSREGACIETPQRLAIGQKIRLEARGLPPLTAIVCWRELPAYGLSFQQSFTFEELARLAARLQPITPGERARAQRAG